MRRPRVAALLLGAALVALSCGEPAAPKPSTLRADLLAGAGLLQCTPIPTATTTQRVDSTGGVIQVGPHTLTIPPGALSDPVTITAVAPSDTINRVQFGPTGLTFQRPASLTMSYANCGLLPSLLPQIAYTTDALQILAYLTSVADPWSQTVTAPVQHFSDYAVAW
jgi:hypothetical protein